MTFKKMRGTTTTPIVNNIKKQAKIVYLHQNYEDILTNSSPGDF